MNFQMTDVAYPIQKYIWRLQFYQDSSLTTKMMAKTAIKPTFYENNGRCKIMVNGDYANITRKYCALADPVL